MRTALRFLRAFRGLPDVREEEVTVTVDGAPRQATLFAPLHRRSPGPGWIVLHGITVSGRKHPSLVGFASAAAAAGRTVLVPDVPAWRALEIDVEAARSTMEGGSQYLADHPEVDRDRGTGVVGLSFGATHALIAASDRTLRDRVKGLVGFGGYSDLGACFRFAFTGEHEWEGRRYRLRPDPYGRWIVTASYIAGAEGYGGCARIAEGARLLARASASAQTFAGDSEFDRRKTEIAAGLDAAERRIWKLVAPASASPLPSAADREDAVRLADALAAEAIRQQPALDPGRSLDELRARTVLAHGFGDRLIPFSETHRLHERLPPAARSRKTITRLFAHSTGDERLGPLQRITETGRFLRLIDRALKVV